MSKIERCRRMPRNLRGRDFVVGDLHGHRALLEQRLERLGFDPANDRLFSVGDLADRGPESLRTLQLIEEPWFHAVLGNHELMLLNFLRYYDSRLHSRKSFVNGSGAWIVEALASHRKLVVRLADRLASLPLALHVDGEMPFAVMHGDLSPIGSSREQLLGSKSVDLPMADLLTSSRDNFAAALKAELLGLKFEHRQVQVSDSPLGALPITYVGHSPAPTIMVHRSYVYIDQGACMPSSRRPDPVEPTVLEHQRFAYWFSGVLSARNKVVPKRQPSPVAREAIAA